MFINGNHRGLAYGDGHIQGDGKLGRFVKVVGDDLFAVNTDPTSASFGVLIKDYKDGEMPGIYCQGGVYETDVFEGTIGAGDELEIDTSGVLIVAGTQQGAKVVAQAISVSGGILKFRLLI